ncbi:MAG TPA: hypothetical protein VGE15_02155 [Sphingobacteriaceae bacterium]
MKNESTIKLTEKFDQELLNILKEDLKAVRSNRAGSVSRIFIELPIAS